MDSLVEQFPSIVGALENYNSGMRPMTWISLFSFMLENGMFGINYGSSGLGKSRSTTELADRLSLVDATQIDEMGNNTAPVVVAPNNCTDRIFFDFLRNHANKCLIIDDASVLSSQQVGFLKEAMGETGMVEYSTARDRERNRFKFVGSIIMNTNYEKQEGAILTRAYINYFYFDHESLVEKRKKSREYLMNNGWEQDLDSWNIIRDRIAEIIMENVSSDCSLLPQLTKKEIEKVYKIVDDIDVGFFSNASMRDDNKAIKIVRLFKRFVGDFDLKDKNVWDEVEMVITHYLSAGIVDTTESVRVIMNQYFRKYGCQTIRVGELKEILLSRYPNHNIKSWIDSALSKGKIVHGSNKQYVTFANVKPVVRMPKR